MMTAVYTLGCKLNQCESEALADAFYTQGFSIVHHTEPAELFVVNTCTVTSKAEQKARRMIRKFAAMDHSPIVLVTGCYAEMEPHELRSLHGTIIVIPLTLKPRILTLPSYVHDRMKMGFSLYESVHEWINTIDFEGNSETEVFNYKAVTFLYHARAFLKIEDGCDNNCAYCRVTLARGKAISIDRDEAVLRALTLEKEGYREIVLTGVNITAYRSKGEGLEGLLRELLEKLKRTKIRLSSLEPDMITDELISLCSHDLVQPHFHIPVQSGSDSVLTSVNRSYSAESIKECVSKLRSVKKDPFLAADIITGLPGESDQDAAQTFALLKECDFSKIHVFPFSPRPGTELYTAEKRVAESLRDQRADKLRKLSVEQHSKYQKRWVGENVSVLLENRKQEYWTGLSDNYLHLKVSGVPEGEREDNLIRGSLCRVTIIQDSVDDNMFGEFIDFIEEISK
ncbi:MAG: tRNA (N(6)-L-threonylcarbamoyladenosine(37)-C(2))-methylthiotransferase MtaB [Spirochaetia bacterium]|nr:tRNA (N(6)-L-threonylcarbamoyladenosine(37)-C(2))-methylthiotransferase MtaB [Spirochaetia bacterium]